MWLRRIGFSSMALVVCALACVPLTGRAKNAAASIVMVPMQVELNRPYIDVTLTGPNGRSVKAHAYVDTGGGGLILSAGLTKSLGLKATGKALHEEGQTLVPVATPALRIGDKNVELVDAHALVDASEPGMLDHTHAEMMLPGRFLSHYVVTFDYPAHTFTLANAGSYKSDGKAVATTIGGGMPVVHASVSGKPYAFLLDTGGQYCMISKADLGAWEKQHPAWPRVAGAYGPANMLLGPFEAKLFMLRIASLQWGPFRIENAGTVSRSVGNYERGMSQIVGTPIIGSIGGNVLRHFKVTVDYPAKQVYLDGPKTVRDASLDMVGIMLEPAADGGYEVASTAAGVKDIQVGDRLLEVDGKDVTHAPFSQVAQWLSGSPDESRTLVLQRGGARVTVHAATQTIL
ncbi:MAG: hypothetical protein EPN36_10145 [Rhodanobacteraceae bacterium]|nr:MAG: hypothetical protein EPN36_10145 [Rhodanobacteraceae bacterium]